METKFNSSRQILKELKKLTIDALFVELAPGNSKMLTKNLYDKLELLNELLISKNKNEIHECTREYSKMVQQELPKEIKLAQHRASKSKLTRAQLEYFLKTAKNPEACQKDLIWILNKEVEDFIKQGNRIHECIEMYNENHEKSQNKEEQLKYNSFMDLLFKYSDEVTSDADKENKSPNSSRTDSKNLKPKERDLELFAIMEQLSELTMPAKKVKGYSDQMKSPYNSLCKIIKTLELDDWRKQEFKEKKMPLSPKLERHHHKLSLRSAELGKTISNLEKPFQDCINARQENSAWELDKAILGLINEGASLKSCVKIYEGYHRQALLDYPNSHTELNEKYDAFMHAIKNYADISRLPKKGFSSRATQPSHQSPFLKEYAANLKLTEQNLPPQQNSNSSTFESITL